MTLLTGQKNPFISWLVSNSLLPTKLKEAPTELFIDRLFEIVLGDARPLSDINWNEFKELSDVVITEFFPFLYTSIYVNKVSWHLYL